MDQHYLQLLQQLQADTQQLQQQVAQLVALQAAGQAPVAPPPPPRRKIPVSVPDKFAGQREMFPTFMGQCQLFMALRPEDFPNDRARVGFVISLLSGSAAQWATSLLLQDSPLLTDLQGFWQHMRLLYEDPFRPQTAAWRIKNLRQGRRPLQDYVAEFRLLSQDARWNEVALMDAFQDGLSDELQDELVRVEAPLTLDALVEQCLRMDHRFQRRRSRRAPQEPPGPVAPPRSVPPAPRPAPRPVLPAEEPMELGAARPRLTAQERSRRRLRGLCLYCGEPGHFAASCPRKRGGAPPPGPDSRPDQSGKRSTPDLGETLGRAQTKAPPETAHVDSGSPRHLILDTRVWVADRKEGIQAHALVDSGATTNFMDRAFVAYYDIPVAPVHPPLRVETIDGRELLSGPIKYATQPLRLVVGDHEEAIRFYVAADLHLPVVLGMAWLRTHDPQVTWSQNGVAFTSLQCVDHIRHTCAGQNVSAPAVSLPSELTDFADVFSEREADRIPPHRPYDCAVDLRPDAPLPVGRLYAMSEPELAALRDFLEKNLARGFIRPSTSPVSAPVLFVKKKTGDLRMCCDYRRLNAITVRNRYPLPLIPELMERLREASIFTKLDLRGAYNLVRMREGDEWKTAFGTRYGHFEFLVMPFGLTNAPAVFQHLMNDIFRDMLDRFVVVYLDDILIYSPSRDSHVQHVRRVLQRLREHQLYAKLEKCLFSQTSIEFLGHIITPEGIAMDPRKVEALCTWESPRRVKDVQRLLGFANYYRTFIPGFATLTLPLTQLLRKKVPFTWGSAQQQAFQVLKRAFVTQPILRHPDPRRPFVVETDASNVAVGAVLLQASADSGTLFPCAYYSRKLSPSERNYTIWEKELLAIKAALEAWRHHLEGARHPVEVRTDHKNLEHLTTARKLNQRQIRWSLFFARFNFRVTYIPSGHNQRADALSRKPEYAGLQDPLPLRTVLPAESLAAVQEPVDLRAQVREAQRLDDWSQQRRADVGPASPWALEEGLLKHRGRLYVPTGPLRALVLRQCHDSRTAGHFGVFKTLHLVTRTFWWPRVRHDVFGYVTSCETCRRAKAASGRPPGLLQPLPTPERPWGAISMDFLTDLPPSATFTTVLVVVDMLTKMAHFIPCRGLPSARTTARLFLQHVFRLHGLPDRVVSDRGAQFTARFWKSLMAALEVQVCLSSAHHPETDGGTERVIGILEQYLRCVVNQQQNDWAEFLPLAEFAFNNSQHTSTQDTPFHANLGFHPRFFPLTMADSPVPDTRDFLSELRAVQQLVRRQLIRAKEDYKRVADRSRRATPPLAVGDRVWLSTKHLPTDRPVRKLDHRFIGPFPVEAVINPVAYRVTLPRSMRIHPVFHRSLLVPEAPSSSLRRPAVPAPPAATTEDGAVEYEVDSIRDSRWLKGRFQYLIAWKGYGPEDFTWEDTSSIHAPDLIQDFHDRFPSRPHPDRPTRGKGPAVGDSVVSSAPEPRPLEEEASESEEEEEEARPPSPGPSGLATPQAPAESPEEESSSESDGDDERAWTDPRWRRLERRAQQRSGWGRARGDESQSQRPTRYKRS